MVSPYRLAGYAGIASLIFSVFLAAFILSVESKDYSHESQYLTYIGVLMISIGLTILYYRGFIIFAKNIKDSKFLIITLAVFILTLLAAIAQFIYSSLQYLDTLAFSIYDALMHQNIAYGELIFSIHLSILSLLFGYGLIKSKIPLRLAYHTGMVSVIAGLTILLISTAIGYILYLAAGIMMIILLFKLDSPVPAPMVNGEEGYKQEIPEKEAVKAPVKKAVRRRSVPKVSTAKKKKTAK
jgi:hypothetical protein